MDLQQILADARTHDNALEAIAHVLLTALKAGGADDEAIAQVTETFDAHLGAVGVDDTLGLAEVLDIRLQEILERGAFDDAIKLMSRMTMIEAHLAHDALAEMGVASRLRHDSLPGAEFPEPPSQVELWVRKGDVAKAKSVLTEMTQKADKTVDCPACGEGNPANFATCWSCHAAI